MHKKIKIIICLLAPLCLSLTDPQQIKQKITQLESLIGTHQGVDKSKLMVDLAIAYNEDQNREQAFKTFLDALSFYPNGAQSYKPSDEELAYYQEALKLYLEHHTGQEVITSAEKIVETYGPVLSEHPHYYQLNFLVAAAQANLAHYDLFFKTFYDAYQHDPQCYMSYRTQAVLHIKLYERARSVAEREAQAKSIYQKVMLAVEANPRDPSLYKMMISFAPTDDKNKIIASALKKIVSDNIIVPRADIAFYVTEALNSNQKESAQQFVDKAKEWYQYSKVVNAAQQLIDQSRG